MVVAVQEQRNILQELVWKTGKFNHKQAYKSFNRLPDSTLVLLSDYFVEKC